MSEASDLAAKIDAMTLDELMRDDRDSLPRPGGDYDTKTGWARRMGKTTCDNTFKRAWARMDAAGLLVPVVGMTKRGEHWQRHTLYHCPTLAKKCGD